MVMNYKKRNIFGYVEILKAECPDWRNCLYVMHINAAREEIKQHENI